MGGSALLGIGGLLASKVLAKKPPKIDKAPVVNTEAASRKAKLSRSALIENEGGINGVELSPDQVQRRGTIFGN